MTLKTLLVYPGPLHSTRDCAAYYLDAMRNDDYIDAQPFNYHNVLAYHYAGVKTLRPDLSDTDAQIISQSRGSRELLAEIAHFIPDFLFVVAGTMIPIDTWYYVLNLRSNFKKKFGIALYLTECPYLDTMQMQFARFADVLFLNDKISLRTFDPFDNKHVYYLPHSYNHKVHYKRMNMIDEVTSDVLFCGTAFAERVDLLSKVDWTGIDFRLMGVWKDYTKLAPYVVHDAMVTNESLATWYSGAKISLNIHRTRADIDESVPELNNYTDAYSMNPRIREAVMCGSFVLTDFRQEIVDVFGDTVEIYNDAKDMEDKIKFWLHRDNESLREERIVAAQELIKNHSFNDRLESIVFPVLNQIVEGDYYHG